MSRSASGRASGTVWATLCEQLWDRDEDRAVGSCDDRRTDRPTVKFGSLRTQARVGNSVPIDQKDNAVGVLAAVLLGLHLMLLFGHCEALPLWGLPVAMLPMRGKRMRD